MRTQEANTSRVGNGWWAFVDVAVVLAFVVIGRDSHGEGNAFSEVLATAAPFMIGLVAGWLVTDARLTPVAIRTGASIAAVTVVVGLVVRRIVFGDGIATPFIIVTTLVLTAGLVGWRAVARAWRRRSSPG